MIRVREHRAEPGKRERHWRPFAGLGLVTALLGLLLTPSTRVVALRAAGRVLVAEDSLAERADIVVVPEWAGAAGALEVCDIVKRGVSSRVAILPGPQLLEELSACPKARRERKPKAVC